MLVLIVSFFVSGLYVLQDFFKRTLESNCLVGMDLQRSLIPTAFEVHCTLFCKLSLQLLFTSRSYSGAGTAAALQVTYFLFLTV